MIAVGRNARTRRQQVRQRRRGRARTAACARPGRLRLATTRPFESTNQQRGRASDSSSPSAIIAATTRSAMPVPASPGAEEQQVARAERLAGAIRSADHSAGQRHGGRALDVVVEAEHAGPGTSSAAGTRSALPKSSNWMSALGNTARAAVHELVDQLVVRLAAQPPLRAGRGTAGRASSASLLVPTSSVTGRHAVGSMPAHAV